MKLHHVLFALCLALLLINVCDLHGQRGERRRTKKNLPKPSTSASVNATSATLSTTSNRMAPMKSPWQLLFEEQTKTTFANILSFDINGLVDGIIQDQWLYQATYYRALGGYFGLGGELFHGYSQAVKDTDENGQNLDPTVTGFSLIMRVTPGGEPLRGFFIEPKISVGSFDDGLFSNTSIFTGYQITYYFPFVSSFSYGYDIAAWSENELMGTTWHFRSEISYAW